MRHLDKIRYLTSISLFVCSAFSFLIFCSIYTLELSAQERDVLVIYFDPDVNSISKDSLTKIDERLDDIKSAPDYKITLEGYSDITGRADYNLELSKKRAQLVKDYLVNQGVDPDKIRALGKGGTEYFAAGETDEALQKNRRVNLVIDYPPEPEPEPEIQSLENHETTQTSDETQETIGETQEVETVSEDERLEVAEANADLKTPSHNLSKMILKKIRHYASDSIIFITPPEMVVGQSYVIEAEISHSFIESLSKDLDNPKLENNIGMKLRGSSFDISPYQENGYDIQDRSDNRGLLAEKWLVTPEREGIRSLILSIDISGYTISESGSSQFDTFQRVIEVRASMIHSITSSYWVMGFLIVLIVAVVVWILIRRIRLV